MAGIMEAAAEYGTDILLDVSGFDGILDSDDTTVQKALDSIDDWGQSLLAESVDDRVAVLLQDASGLTWSYDDEANTLTPAIDHGGMNGLADDDHTQYLLATGARAVTNGLVINESGADSDTRIESSGNANMLFVDAGQDNVGIGGTPYATWTLQPVGRYPLLLRNTDYNHSDTGTALKMYFGASSGDTYAVLQVVDAGGSSQNNIVLQPSGGNVGINNNAPQALLHIDHDTSNYANEGDYALKIEDGANDVGLLFGVDATNNIAIIQSMDPGTSFTTRPLHLNPNGGGLVVNEGGADSDTRIESTGNANMLFVDAGDDRVGIGTNAPANFVHINYESDTQYLTGLEIGRTSSGQVGTPRSIDLAFSDGPNKGFIGGISAIRDNSSGNWNSTLKFYTSSDSTPGASDVQSLQEAMSIDYTMAIIMNNGLTINGAGLTTKYGVVINEDGNDSDTRIESTGNANMLFVDAGNDRVGIGTNAPAVRCHVYDSANSAKVRIETDKEDGTASTDYLNDAQSWTVGVASDDTYSIYDGTYGLTPIIIEPNSGTGCLRIRADGNVDFRIGNINAWGHRLIGLRSGTVGSCALQFDGDGDTGLCSLSADQLDWVTGGVARVTLTTTTLVVNESGADLDTRIESTGNANMLFVDAGNDRVGIGTNGPLTALHVYHATANGVMTMESGDASAYMVYKDNSTTEYIAAGVTANDFEFLTNSTVRVKLLSGGNVELQSGTDLDANGQDIDNASGIGVYAAATAGSPLWIYDATYETTTPYYGIYEYVMKTAGATDAGDSIVGGYLRVGVNHNGSTVGALAGFRVGAILDDGGVGDGTHAYDMYGFESQCDLNGGKVWGDAYGMWTIVDQEAANEVVDDVFGHYISVDAAGTVGDKVYMLYLKEVSNVDYGIYQDGSAKNVFGGDVEIAASKSFDAYTNSGYVKIRRIRQAAAPSPEAGEIIIWCDSDDDSVHLVVNDPTGGDAIFDEV